MSWLATKHGNHCFAPDHPCW